jgi:hypothetical protein
MALACAVGFRAFLLHGKAVGNGDVTPAIAGLVTIHGLSLFAWVGLFFAQTVLIRGGNPRLHRKLGYAGAVLAVLIVPLGITTAVSSTHLNPRIYDDFGGAKTFLAVMLSEMVAFAAFVGMGIWYRRRPAIHRPMMLLATMMISSGSLARVPWISSFGQMAPLSVYGPVLAFGVLLILLQWAMSGDVNRWYLKGYACLFAWGLASYALGTSRLWLSITASYIGH